MTVRELIEILTTVDPDRMVVIPPMAYGTTYEEMTVVQRSDEGGIGHRFGDEAVPVVILGFGDGDWMRKQGLDVVGFVKPELPQDLRKKRIVPGDEG